MTLDELITALEDLEAEEDSIKRAAMARDLIEKAQRVISQVRCGAIYAATRENTYQYVAQQLGVSEATVNAAIRDYRGEKTDGRA